MAGAGEDFTILSLIHIHGLVVHDSAGAGVGTVHSGEPAGAGVGIVLSGAAAGAGTVHFGAEGSTLGTTNLLMVDLEATILMEDV